MVLQRLIHVADFERLGTFRLVRGVAVERGSRSAARASGGRHVLGRGQGREGLEERHVRGFFVGDANSASAFMSATL